jgi:hypothetical protein
MTEFVNVEKASIVCQYVSTINKRDARFGRLCTHYYKKWQNQNLSQKILVVSKSPPMADEAAW